MSAPARECSSPMKLSPISGSQSSSPLDFTASLKVGLILGATPSLLDNCRPCLFQVQQTFVSALLTQCFKDKNKRHSRWFPLKKFAPPKNKKDVPTCTLPGGQCTSWQSSSPKSTAGETKSRRGKRTGVTMASTKSTTDLTPPYSQIECRSRRLGALTKTRVFEVVLAEPRIRSISYAMHMVSL